MHHRNRLAGGVDVDLTRDQFSRSEIVQCPEVIPRPSDLAWACLLLPLRRLAMR
jgi:hypothetical protein